MGAGELELCIVEVLAALRKGDRHHGRSNDGAVERLNSTSALDVGFRLMLSPDHARWMAASSLRRTARETCIVLPPDGGKGPIQRLPRVDCRHEARRVL
jgi:hypothetical protein